MRVPGEYELAAKAVVRALDARLFESWSVSLRRTPDGEFAAELDRWPFGAPSGTGSRPRRLRARAPAPEEAWKALLAKIVAFPADVLIGTPYCGCASPEEVVLRVVAAGGSR